LANIKWSTKVVSPIQLLGACMTAKNKTLAEINEEAFNLLFKHLGPADTIRFIHQYWQGSGDYTKEREALYADMTLDDILEEMARREAK
jgi:hypothetical protein